MNTPQTAPHKIFSLITASDNDDLKQWAVWYFEHEVTTAESSQRAQHSDLKLFFAWLTSVHGTTQRDLWTPRAAGDFQKHMQSTYTDNKRQWSDNTINRVTAHLKTFAKWIHGHSPFILGNPMRKIKMLSKGTTLDIERAITEQERNRILDAADQLLIVGGLSRDRVRNAGKRPAQRKTYRPYRNRAMIYTLTETGMRRIGLVNIDLANVNVTTREITTKEKGGALKTYKISKDGLQAIQDYINHERQNDNEKWQAPALFLSHASNPHGFRENPADNGRLNVKSVNEVWNSACSFAGITDRTPHSARHGMGVYLTTKKGLAAAGRQLQHSNNTYTLEYARVTNQELQDALDER